jgi:hypothetical protein
VCHLTRDSTYIKNALGVHVHSYFFLSCCNIYVSPHSAYEIESILAYNIHLIWLVLLRSGTVQTLVTASDKLRSLADLRGHQERTANNVDHGGEMDNSPRFVSFKTLVLILHFLLPYFTYTRDE